MMRVADHLIDGRPARLGLAAGGHSGERRGGAVKVGVDAAHIAAHVIHIAHDQQLLAERLKRFEHIVKAFVLQRRGNAEAEEHVECAHGHLGLGRAERVGGYHFLQ